MATQASSTHPALDALTVAAIAVLAYVAANVLHEGAGHGGACALVGGDPVMLEAAFFDCDKTGLSFWGRRFISAAGSLVNLIAAGVGLLALRLGSWRPSLRYFLWLFTFLNLLQAFGYFLFSGLLGVGDWAVVVEGLSPYWPLRLGMAALGGLLYFLLTPWLMMPRMEPFLGQGEPRRRRARLLTLLPYLVGGLTYVVATLFNPIGWEIVLISATAASFGGASLLAWIGSVPRPPSASTPEEPLTIPRSVGWILAAGVVLAVFVGILGPGLAL
jgi:hypothetical protein